MRNLILYCLFNLLAVHLLHANKAQTPYSTITIAAFEENKGQVKGYDALDHPEVKFLFQKGNLKIFLTNSGIAYQFENILNDSNSSISNIESYRMTMELIGANPNAEILTVGQRKDYANYYNHNTLDVHSYQKIIYKNIYKDIDWVIYTTAEDELKYDFIVHPGADYRAIRMKYSHAEQIMEDNDGNIIIRNRMGDIVESKPVTIQGDNRIPTIFILKDSVIQFKIQNFDHSKSIRIDPQILWSTYYGGSSTTVHEVATDDSSNVYIAGRTSSSSNIAYNGYQMNIANSSDAFIAKFNPSGTRIWGTYYGGSSSDVFLSISVNNISKNIYAFGNTLSTGLAYNGYKNVPDTLDALLVKFDSGGYRIWATYYGGKGREDSYSCSSDTDENVYIYGITSSDSMIAYNGFQNSITKYTNAGVTYTSPDLFLAKFDKNGNRKWATYFGGTDSEYPKNCFASRDGHIFFSGYASSAPNLSGGNNSVSGFPVNILVKMDSLGNFKWGTYYGGTGTQTSGFCYGDNDGNIYLSGHTTSSANIAYNGFQNALSGSNDAYLVKFSSSGTRLWATYFGGNYVGEEETKVCVDRKGFVYLTTCTWASNLAYRGFKSTLQGFAEAIIVKFNKNGTRIWSSYFGGDAQTRADEEVLSMRTDFDCNLYLGGKTTSSSGLSYNGHQNSFPGGNCGFLTKISCNKAYTILYDTVCKGDSIFFNDFYQTNEGTYFDTLDTWEGCDSVITMNLKVSRRDTMHLYDSICQGTTKTWNGSQVSTAGVYLDTLRNIEKCDSFLIYHLSIRALDSTRIYDTSCGNTPRTWNGMNLTTAGVYLDTLQNRYGCDSFLYYQYIPKMASSSSPIISICKGSSYTVGLKSYAISGTYRDTLKNFHGCDSFVTLSLTVRDTSFTVWTASICQGSYYLFQGDTLRSAGVYRDTLKNRNGCDSTVHVSLSVNSLGSKTIYDTICPDKSYAFAGKLLTSSGSYRDSLKTKKGCDSIVTLHLFLRPKKPLSLVDSIYRLTATTGFSSYKWYRNSLPLSAPNLNYYFPSESGSFKVEVTEKNGCKYFSDSVQVIKAGLHSQHTSLNIEIFPNPAKDHLYIQSTTALDRELRIEIYTIDGRRLSLPMQRISNLLYSISTASLSAGVYTIELKTAERMETRMFVVE